MRTKLISLALAVGISVMACAGTAEATSSSPERHRGVVGTGVALVPCHHLFCVSGVQPLWLTVDTSNPSTPLVSVCTFGTWCTMGGSLWSVLSSLRCSVTDGQTWYGGSWFSTGGAMPEWWSFTVTDGGLGGVDRMAMSTSGDPWDGQCGARGVVTRRVRAGDFQLVRPAR